MSKTRIEQYYREVEEALQKGGSANESALRRHFANLVADYAKNKKLTLVDEKIYINAENQSKYPDGSLLFGVQAVGHWESKDVKDDLTKEIEKKFAIGYPQYNILFENSQTAILFQAPNKQSKGEIRMTANMKNWRELHTILEEFINYETEEIRTFREALDGFTFHVPEISKLLKAIIEISSGEKKLSNFDTVTQLKIEDAEYSETFIKRRKTFFENCKNSINAQITLHDIDEMIIQHILTENIFSTIFGEIQLHKENNIALEVSKIIDSFFKQNLRKNTTDQLNAYYRVIIDSAKSIESYQEKQKFLKLIYEEFYKAYNPQGADRLGIVYTPFEIIQFMLKATDYLLDKHFDHTLNDKDVKILDPCTGTGTFICDLIDYLGLQNLEYKYKNDIYANEVSILPYYIANLNIENTYKEKVGRGKIFENLAFVDTLDNLQGMNSGHFGGSAQSVYGGVMELFGSISKENLKRIHRQNKEKITVIIGNPPYNANQQNENDNNKNRTYPVIDRRVKATYINSSSAQKTKLYDMYTRFFRWASDRIPENGLVAFVTNRSYLDSRSFDGFRKEVAKDFQEIWILDTKSDVRANPKIAGTTHNVFGIQTGVCIAFFLKIAERKDEKCKIMYYSLPDEMRKKEKLNFLMASTLKNVPFERIRPDKNGNWLNQTDNDFDDLVPVCSKDVKNGKGGNAIFELFSLGVVTARDEWVYDFDKKNVGSKVNFLINKYNQEVIRLKGIKKDEVRNEVEYSIKWTRAAKNDLAKGKQYTFDESKIMESLYRPFVKKQLYFSKELNEMQYQLPNLFNISENKLIGFVAGSRLNFTCISTNLLPNYAIYSLDPAQFLPFYRYENGEKIENISDWALTLFRNHAENSAVAPKKKGKKAIETAAKTIEKIDIFHYVYAVLHNPSYRKKYEQNLKRDFPRIPLYADFWKWAEMGKKLMDLHLNYEQIAPYPLKREDKAMRVTLSGLKTKLKADKENGVIILDEQTDLKGIPAQAWEYKLGNRSALEWILDQYKESTPSDPTIAAQFNTYKFADYKEQVIDLLMRVCRVSVETVEMMQEM